MAVFEYYENMYDVCLKPRLLRSLTREHLPDENQPFPAPSDLAKLLSSIKTHGLLSESFVSGSIDKHLIDKWKSAVDAWVERLLLLISSKMLDRRWAGVCLLGVTFQDCSAARFLASYSVWFQKLLPQIQQPSESQLVKVASCASLSDMFTRLSGILSAKKDGVSLAGKLIQPVLKLLTEDASESVWEGAADLLCTLTNFFPSSVHHHYDSVENVILSKIMSGKCNMNLSKKFAYCLALLPKTKGDEDSWSLMLQKILISINSQLNDVFQGLERDTKGEEVMRLLVQPGKDPPPRLGEASDHAAQASEQLLFYRVSTLMQCCSLMLTNPYTVQVSVPVRALLALVRRVLEVDGSSSQDLLSFMTVTQQESICSELPILHLYSLELLTAIIKGIRSQLLPNAAEIGKLIREYFRSCQLPALRIKVYSIIKVLLISTGVGMALYLSQEVVKNASVDLGSFLPGSRNASSNIHSKHARDASQPSKKRKHAGSSSDHQNAVGLELEPPHSKPETPISVQLAALQALEALLTVGGALKSESWRPKVDTLLTNVATNTCEGGWANEERTTDILTGELTATWADFQHAALHALLVSLLSPTLYRPKYLSRGLELFRRGKQEAGMKLAELCAHALLALEVLIHPRALPMSNCHTCNEGLSRRLPENRFSSSQKQNNPFSCVMGVDEPDPDDDLYKSWLANGEEVEAPVSNTEKNKEPSEKDGQHANGNSLTEKLVADGSVSTMDVDKGRSKELIESIDVETGRCVDEFMVSAERSKVAIAFGGDVGTSDECVVIPEYHSGSSGIQSKKSVTIMTDIPSSVVTNTEAAVTSRGAISAAMDDGSASVFDKGKQSISEDNSDTDSIPDIVDADPDSD